MSALGKDGKIFDPVRWANWAASSSQSHFHITKDHQDRARVNARKSIPARGMRRPCSKCGRMNPVASKSCPSCYTKTVRGSR